MQIYFIRHGSTAGNLEHRYVGTTDEALTAEAVQELRAARARYPVADCVFVSPLKRCEQTAEILFPELHPEVISDLRECAFGDFEYKNYQELAGNPDYQAWIDSAGTLAFPSGESRETFVERCCAAFEEGCRRAIEEQHKSAAFVVHGGTIMAILSRYSEPHRDYFEWQVKNARGFAGTLVYKQEHAISSSQSEDMQRSSQTICISDISRLPYDQQPIGIEEQFIMKKNKKLHCGYTTGSCAAAAAIAATEMLLTGRICVAADLMTPKGIPLHLPIQKQCIEKNFAECAVRKYGGDDPDATDGLLIYARAEYIAAHEGRKEPKHQKTQEPHVTGSAQERYISNVIIDGGVGVGRVTKPGLEQPVGAAAINRVPREMIANEVASVCEAYEYEGQIKITISVPRGVEIAKKTFNPHIGIEGGISILGTSGIVVPMSEEALLASIRLEMQQKYTNGERYLLMTPGNYGADFIRRKELAQALDAEHSMKCSNFVGETVDMAAELGFKGILFVAHIGKFIKVSGGIMNTHSAHADCRVELMAAQALRAMRKAAKQKGLDAGEIAAQLEIAQQLLDTNTTEEAAAILREKGILELTIAEVTKQIKYHLQKHCEGMIETEVILFSNQYGYLGETDGAEIMAEKIISQK